MPKTIFRDGVRELLEEGGAQVVDVLPAEEYGESHLPGAINIPLKELDQETTAGLGRDAPAGERGPPARREGACVRDRRG